MNLDLTQSYYIELANRTHDLIVERAGNEQLNKILQEKDKEIGRLKKILEENGISYENKEEEDEPNQE